MWMFYLVLSFDGPDDREDAFSSLTSMGCSKGAPIFRKPPVSDIAFSVYSLFLKVTNP
jgi:hypothetical protein